MLQRKNLSKCRRRGLKLMYRSLEKTHTSFLEKMTKNQKVEK